MDSGSYRPAHDGGSNLHRVPRRGDRHYRPETCRGTTAGMDGGTGTTRTRTHAGAAAFTRTPARPGLRPQRNGTARAPAAGNGAPRLPGAVARGRTHEIGTGEAAGSRPENTTTPERSGRCAHAIPQLHPLPCRRAEPAGLVSIRTSRSAQMAGKPNENSWVDRCGPM